MANKFKKHQHFTAANGEGYFVNTTGGAFTATLPAPSAGDIVAIKDYAINFDTNNLTVARNGSNIQGGTADATLDVEGESINFSLCRFNKRMGANKMIHQ